MKKILRLSLMLCMMLVSTVASAADAYKTLTFPAPTQDAVGAYNKSWNATGADGQKWTIYGFNNNNSSWKYIKCGSKKAVDVAYIETAEAVDKAIGNIVVTIDKFSADYVNSVKLLVAKDTTTASFAAPEQTIDVSAAQGDITIPVTTPAANKCYRLVFDCKKGSDNGFVQVSKVALYEQGSTPTIVDISNTKETAYTIAKAKELIDAGEGLAANVYVKGIVSSKPSYSSTYKNINYYIKDDINSTTDSLEVYGGNGLDNKTFEDEASVDVHEGDEVIVYGQLTKYKTTYEINKGNYIVSLVSTGIATPKAAVVNANTPVYNLAGQRVSKAYKGIVVVNGKKYVK
ncbi:MAG: hypothetical protein PUD15_03415 [Prevotella sp.]|nr:hypothetical protein [Prevotella sp.]